MLLSIILTNAKMGKLLGTDTGTTHAGCSYPKQLCTNKFKLYQAFFRSGKEQLYRYLETLCDYLYDDLRLHILHELCLPVLCEVCTVLQVLMVLDATTPNALSDDKDGEPFIELDQLHMHKPACSSRHRWYYTPMPMDLTYPDKLWDASGMPAPVMTVEKKTEREVEKERLLRLLALDDTQGVWFPPLQMSI
ncbi:hypothetical protein B0H17DRAFT_1198129 [Mycena rosella]|uniref:Conserved oligomeric Golgi complex subunit 3 C-terminal domain-containing protein n=1 Tax=Mycena rosella TaxID=1033263 RepID=A0AAD7DPF9_MYCRO|nr:hypothetical protein B0H17DRAFT_1198129 [Mycena rosella]